MTEETNTNNSTHIYDVVLKAITKLPDEEKEVLLDLMTINNVVSLIVSQENLKEYVNSIDIVLKRYSLLVKALADICNIMNDTMDGVSDLVCDYNKLDTDEKKEATLKLMNNSTFQKDCCEILVGDMERIVEEDTTVKAFNDMFNITGWYKKLIKQGIGLNHEYKK